METNIWEHLCSCIGMSLLIVLALKLTKSSNTMAETIIVTIFKCWKLSRGVMKWHPERKKLFFFTLKLVSFMHFYAKTTFCIIHFDLWVSLLYFTNACINKGKYWTICGFWNVFTLDQSWYFICALKLCILCLCSMVTRKLYMCFLFKTPRHKCCKKIFSFFLYCLEGERSVST